MYVQFFSVKPICYTNCVTNYEKINRKLICIIFTDSLSVVNSMKNLNSREPIIIEIVNLISELYIQITKL